jgi:4-amino-4-deoxy-L-arabinose transferase-like glycosyltransferase
MGLIPFFPPEGPGSLPRMRRAGACPSAPSRAFWAGMAPVLVLATFLRVHDLGNLPPGFFCDEASLGYNAYSILESGRDENGQRLPLFVWSFGVAYKNPVFIYASIGPIAALGLSEQSVRLTAALFGVVGVMSVGLLGRLVLGSVGGLAAAFFLAVMPWHLHFSRIAFELISLLPLFAFGFAALIAGLGERPRWLLAAAVLFGLSLYAYAPAKLFVPAFLLGAAVVYRRALWERRAWVAAGALLGSLTIAPLVIFELTRPETAGQYFRATTILRAGEPLASNATRVFDQYLRFWSRSFLFESGDPIPRHAVPGFGELHPSMLPLLSLGLLWALWPRRPAGKLLLWWLILYPVAPALMNEAPSASRGFIGVGAFCLLAAAGVVLLLDLLARLIAHEKVRSVTQTLAVAALVVWTGRDTWRYWQAYAGTYPRQAARDFQYGYRETIRFMEARRKDYDLLLLTARDVNQPQIFTAFYTRADPRLHRQDAGYLIIDPAEIDRYAMNQRILGALREKDLPLFSEYDELHRVRTPAGGVEFVIAEVKKRRRFLRDWLVLGPFGHRGRLETEPDRVDPRQITREGHRGILGPVSWQQIRPQFVRVDLNAFYGGRMAAAGRPLERLCAFAVTQLGSAEEREAFLELSGPPVVVQAWADGEPLMPAPTVLMEAPRRVPLRLAAGETEIVMQVCKQGGDWYFMARVTDGEGRDLEEVGVRPVLRAAGRGDA